MLFDDGEPLTHTLALDSLSNTFFEMPSHAVLGRQAHFLSALEQEFPMVRKMNLGFLNGVSRWKEHLRYLFISTARSRPVGEAFLKLLRRWCEEKRSKKGKIKALKRFQTKEKAPALG